MTNGEHSNAAAPPTTEPVSHTPGPWEGEPQCDGLGVRVWDKAGHNMIAALDEEAAAGACYLLDVQVREANARLIAAAPDLLALARQYAGECALCGGSGENIHASGPAPEDEYSKTCEDCAEIRAVIAKAEGRS